MTYEFVVATDQAILRETASNSTVGRIDFRSEEDRYFLDYLWVDPSRRGQGLARKTLDHFADFVRARGASITPICGVARKMMTGDERYVDLLVSS